MKNKELVQVLLNCSKHCNHCADASLNSGYIEMMVDCIRINQVCAEICNTTAKILSLSYDNVDDLVDYCQSICESCASECKKHKNSSCINLIINTLKLRTTIYIILIIKLLRFHSGLFVKIDV